MQLHTTKGEHLWRRQRFVHLIRSFPQIPQPINVSKQDWHLSEQSGLIPSVFLNIHPRVTSLRYLRIAAEQQGRGSLSDVSDAECWWRDNQPQSAPTERQTAVKSLTNQCLQRKRWGWVGGGGESVRKWVWYMMKKQSGREGERRRKKVRSGWRKY